MQQFISYPLFTLVQIVQYCTSNTVCVSCSVQLSPPSAVSCECCIRLIEFAKSCEVVAIATGDPAQDRGAVVTMTTAMAVTRRGFFWSCRNVDWTPVKVSGMLGSCCECLTFSDDSVSEAKQAFCSKEVSKKCFLL